MPLCVLEHINIIGDALNLEVIALHFIIKSQEVEGIPSCAPFLEMLEEVLRGNIGVNGFGVSKFSDLGVSDSGKDE